MQKWLLGALAAAFVMGVSGSGVMAEDGVIHVPPLIPPNDTPPILGNAQLRIVSGGHASDRALEVVERSRVFAAASPTVPGLAHAPGLTPAP